jgi:hypothetical protein
MAPTGRPLRLLALTGTPPDVAPDEEPSEIFLTRGSERRGALAWSYDAIMAGAAGYVLKQIRVSPELLDGRRLRAHGHRHLYVRDHGVAQGAELTHRPGLPSLGGHEAAGRRSPRMISTGQGA